MGENNTGKVHRDNVDRPALGDVTNQLENKGFPLVTRSPTSKKLSGNKRAAENTDEESHFWNQVSLVVEKIEKENFGVAKCLKVSSNEVGLSPLRGGKTYRLLSGSGDVGSVDGNVGVGARDVVVEIKEPSCSALDTIDLGEDQHLANFVNLDDGVKEGGGLSGFCKKKSIEVGKECQGEETKVLSDVVESVCSPEELTTQILSDSSKSRSDSIETLKFTESQETRSFGLGRCTLVKGDGSDNLADGVDLLKTCSCSFCTIAGYTWSDLQCQDIKGRISTLAKSQKEATNLARRYSKEIETGEAQGNSNMAPHIETDLTTLWKSLFLHMDNIYGAESSQLQSNFAVFKDIREDYKMNLEMINVLPPDTLQCSSDASEF